MQVDQNKSAILIVDDEPVTQLMIEMMLQRNNYKVIMAYNGEDALNHLADETIDLVIADINMPKMGGISLLREIRADERFQSLPVIMLTALGQRDIQQKALSSGATGFLTKPISSNQLTSVIAKYLSPSVTQ
ncbi:MAG: response regulator [Anaerolineae bacterium]|jgi:CheY-like chemotaxis protein